MIQTIKRMILSLSAVAVLAAPVAVGAQAGNTLDPNCGGIKDCLTTGTNTTDPNGATGNAGDRVNNIIKTVINIFSLIVGIVAVIMIIIGGLKYITSGGDSGNVTGAKNTILYAIVGLIVVALAQIIVKFVLEKATGA
jgi:hypothetical protein